MKYKKVIAFSYYTYKEPCILSCVNCRNYLGHNDFGKQKEIKVKCEKCKTEQIHKYEI